MTKQVPSVGRVVHFVLPNGPHEGVHRPAIITTVHNDPAQPDSACNLTVFSEWGDDVSDEGRVRYVHQGDGVGSWHWPEYVAPVDTVEPTPTTEPTELSVVPEPVAEPEFAVTPALVSLSAPVVTEEPASLTESAPIITEPEPTQPESAVLTA